MGMNSFRDLVKILTPEQVQSIMLTHQVIDNFSITDNKEYIRYKCRPDPELCAISGANYEELLLKSDRSYSNVDSSPAIAAAVTSYARIKRLNFEDFCVIMKLVQSKDHLTVEGLDKIKKIKVGMNLGIK